jgi:Ca-activated chloride channel family protein
LADEKYFDKKDKITKLLVISDGEDHSDNVDAAEEAKSHGIKNCNHWRRNRKRRNNSFKICWWQQFAKDKDGVTVVTKRNQVLQEIAKATKGLYIDSNNTKTVLESIKKILDNSQKNRF